MPGPVMPGMPPGRNALVHQSRCPPSRPAMRCTSRIHSRTSLWEPLEDKMLNSGAPPPNPKATT
eukprot:7811656-Lingulodinium_polyedra.AAC.1